MVYWCWELFVSPRARHLRFNSGSGGSVLVQLHDERRWPNVRDHDHRATRWDPRGFNGISPLSGKEMFTGPTTGDTPLEAGNVTIADGELTNAKTSASSQLSAGSSFSTAARSSVVASGAAHATTHSAIASSAIGRPQLLLGLILRAGCRAPPAASRLHRC